MPYFLNRDFRNNEFELVAKDKYFVDKTWLIDEINEIINVKNRFVCITLSRRLGKTVKAMMPHSCFRFTQDEIGILCKKVKQNFLNN